MEKYQDLAFEIRRIHGASKVTVIPIVIGALGSISKRAKTWYDKLGLYLNLLEVYSYQPSWEQPISYVRCCVSEPRGVVET